MYKVILAVPYSSEEKIIQAATMSIQNGTLMFFFDKQATKLKQIIPQGSWMSWEAMDAPYAINCNPPKEAKNADEVQGAASIPAREQSQASKGVREQNT